MGFLILSRATESRISAQVELNRVSSSSVFVWGEQAAMSRDRKEAAKASEKLVAVAIFVWEYEAGDWGP